MNSTGPLKCLSTFDVSFQCVVGKVQQFSVDGAGSVREFEFLKHCDFWGVFPPF